MAPTAAPAQRNGQELGGNEYSFWREHTHINLSPVAAPSILGLFGFAASTFMVAANLAGWFGDNTTTPVVLAPFAFTFGGIAQLLAAMWSYRARDALATGIHGAWGSFWIAYGLYQLLVALGTVPGVAANPAAATAAGFWFIGLAAITWTGAVAATAENITVALLLFALAGGSTLLAIGMIATIVTLQTIAAYFLLVSAVLAWYAGSAMTLEGAFRRVILPMGKRHPAPDTPGVEPIRPIQFEFGEPGIRAGQ